MKEKYQSTIQRENKAEKIVCIVTQMEAGGAQGAALRTAEILRARGYYAETWFLYQKRPIYSHEENIRVILDYSPKSITDYLIILARTFIYLKIVKPSGVISFTHYANVIGQILAFTAGVPYRLATQRNPVHTYPKFAALLDKLSGTLGIYTSNIAVSHSTANSFKYHPDRYRRILHTVLNGIYLSEVRPDKKSAREKFGIPTEAKVIGTLGRLSEQKNQAFLLDVVSRLPHVLLTIAGDGELKKELIIKAEHLGISNRVIFLGEIHSSLVNDFLASLDIFCFPSKFEAFGFSLVEAMNMSLPIIASDIPAMHEIIEDSGIILSTQHPSDWEKAINEILCNQDTKEKLSNLSKDRSSNFSIERMVDEYIRILFQTRATDE